MSCAAGEAGGGLSHESMVTTWLPRADEGSPAADHCRLAVLLGWGWGGVILTLLLLCVPWLQGAFIRFGGADMVPQFTQFDAAPHPPVRPMKCECALLLQSDAAK